MSSINMPLEMFRSEKNIKMKQFVQYDPVVVKW